LPKYYVTCMELQKVMDAKSEVDACLQVCWKEGVATVNVPWVVSERGFEKHDDDVIISDYDIMKEYIKKLKD